jgi:BirA family transcriptional regulator, biotin operon repressor / biotin---[acetyl-CoA-carboxylase] ligase
LGEREFDAGALRVRLSGRRIGHRLHFLREVDSTNRLALQLAQEGAPEGTVVIADRQTEGRGRLQRVWQSPPGCNLYVSVLLRPAIPAADAARITLTAGVAVAEAIALFCPSGVGLKWPNDVRMNGGTVDAVVVGIGVNVNMARADFDPEHRELSTSLWEETGQPCVREDVAFVLCEKLEQWYKVLLTGGFAPIRSRWLALSEMGRGVVRVIFRGEVQQGEFAGIDGDGALLLADAAGSLRRITAGDASIVKGM